jgi:hypothetical protein
MDFPTLKHIQYAIPVATAIHLILVNISKLTAEDELKTPIALPQGPMVIMVAMG